MRDDWRAPIEPPALVGVNEDTLPTLLMLLPPATDAGVQSPDPPVDSDAIPSKTVETTANETAANTMLGPSLFTEVFEILDHDKSGSVSYTEFVDTLHTTHTQDTRMLVQMVQASA